jgi:hypothetical protein
MSQVKSLGGKNRLCSLENESENEGGLLKQKSDLWANVKSYR